MAKALTDEQRKLRLEMVDIVAQGIKTQAHAGYYDAAQVEYLTTQVKRIAKFLCVAN
jgi:hypothetical protein